MQALGRILAAESAGARQVDVHNTGTAAVFQHPLTCCAVPAAGSVQSTFTSPGVAVGTVE